MGDATRRRVFRAALSPEPLRKVRKYPDGWFAVRTSLSGRATSTMVGGSFRDLLDFVFVPRWWHIWRYERRNPWPKSDQQREEG
jgi:hypothetical protein